MSHGRYQSFDLRYAGERRLTRMYSIGYGTPKLDGKMDGTASEKIYSQKTCRTYLAMWNYFCDYLKVKGIKVSSFAEAANHVSDYINYLKGRGDLSPSTIHTYFAAVAKVLGLNYADYDLSKRHYREFTRSREKTVNDEHFDECVYADLIAFCRSSGLRRNKELAKLRGDDLVDHGNGSYSIHVRKGKGGKERFSPVVGTPESVKIVVDKMNAAGSNLVWGYIPSRADIHSYRADYARRVYEANTEPNGEKYFMRGAGPGKNQCLDRRGLLAASLALGHCSWKRGGKSVEIRWDSRGRLTDRTFAALKEAAAARNFNIRLTVAADNYLYRGEYDNERTH